MVAPGAIVDPAEVDPGRWLETFDELMVRVAKRFRRVERRRAGLFVQGLLADLPCKNCWTLAENAGEAMPDRMQPVPRPANPLPATIRARTV